MNAIIRITYAKDLQDQITATTSSFTKKSNYFDVYGCELYDSVLKVTTERFTKNFSDYKYQTSMPSGGSSSNRQRWTFLYR